MSAVRPSFFHANLCTYADLGRAGEAIVAFVEMAIGLGDRAGIPLRISLERERPRRPRAGRKLTATVWRGIRESVLEGAYAYLFVFNDSASGLANAPLPDRVISFSLAIQAADLFAGLASRARTERARELLLQAAGTNPRFVNLAIGAEPGGDRLERIVQVVRETFRQVDGACGFITLDPFQFISGDLTQHELSRRVSSTTTANIYHSRLRGAFWGNLLSRRHVALLGGYARVVRDAPCQFVEPLPFGETSSEDTLGAYLQLTEHPARVSAQQLETLSRYLAPVLP